MTTYYLDDGGSNTSPYDTWAKAANALQTILSIAGAGDIIKVETTHVEISSGSDFDLNYDANVPGLEIVRVDKDSSDAYDPSGSTYNFQTTGGIYEIDIDGPVTFHGMRFSSNEKILCGTNYKVQAFRDCHFELGVGDYSIIYGHAYFKGCTFLTQDTSNTNSYLFSFYSMGGDGPVTFQDCTFSTGNEYRENILYGSAGPNLAFIGCDFSVMTRNPVSLSQINSNGDMRFIDCKLPPNYQGYASGATVRKSRLELIRCNGTDEIEVHVDNGTLISEATIVRTDGAAKTWETTTKAQCGKTNPLYTPWVYAVVDAAESKDFDIHFAYSGSRLTEEEIFMELELMDSASAPYGTAISSQKKAVLGDSVGNPNTASETWGGSETYEEYLRITQTVGVANSLVRARIGIEKTSQTDEIYIDPKLEIS